jgi:hypothetical protein
MQATIFLDVFVQKYEVSSSAKRVSHQSDVIGIYCSYNSGIPNWGLMFLG